MQYCRYCFCEFRVKIRDAIGRLDHLTIDMQAYFCVCLKIGNSHETSPKNILYLFGLLIYCATACIMLLFPTIFAGGQISTDGIQMSSK